MYKQNIAKQPRKRIKMSKIIKMITRRIEKQTNEK